MFHIGDKARIKQEPTIGTLDDPVRGEYEVGDVTEIIAVIYENDKIWYELNVYLYEDEQCLWQDEDLEMVKTNRLFIILGGISWQIINARLKWAIW